MLFDKLREAAWMKPRGWRFPLLLAALWVLSVPEIARAQHGTLQSPPPLVEPLQGVDIWSALAFENGEALQRLIASGADVNKADGLSLITPVMVAESFPLAKILVDAGADVTARDRFGHSVLHYAVRMRDAASIIPLYVSHGADPNAGAENSIQSTPLMAAVNAYLDDRDLERAAATIRALVAAGANLNLRDHQGQTVLSIAAARADAGLVKLLLRFGADPSAPLADGRTIAEQARANGAFESAALLDEALAAKRRGQ